LKAKRSKTNARRRANFRLAEKRVISNKEIEFLQNSPCFYCGSKERITIDHIIPLARGGRHSIGNFVSACHSCNSKKHARFIMEWRLNKPRADSLRRADPRSL
jgi:5-methylcytosine-specific restriction endonuclease McrA